VEDEVGRKANRMRKQDEKNIKKTINREINKDKNYNDIIDILCILETILPSIFLTSETSRLRKSQQKIFHHGSYKLKLFWMELVLYRISPCA
jgi:hypothetical protein